MHRITIRMKYAFIYLLFTFFCLGLKAQTNRDSLWNVWTNESLSDTVRLASLEKYIDYNLIRNNPNEALNLANEMLDLSIIKGIRDYQAKAYVQISRVARENGNKIEASKNLVKAFKISENIEDNKGVAEALYSLGVIHWQMGQYPKSIDYHFKSLNLYREQGELENISGILNNIGNIYKERGDYTTALQYYEESNEVIKAEGAVNVISLSNIGTIYIKQGRYAEALEYYKKLINPESLGLKLNYYFPETHNAGIQKNLGIIYMHLGDFEASLDHYLQSIAIYQAASSFNRIPEIQLNIGLLNESAGEVKSAVEWCQKSIDEYEKLKSIVGQRDACECLYKAYKLAGDQANALAYFEQYQRFSDSLQIEETAESLQKMEFANQMTSDSIKQAEEDQRIELLHNNEVLKKDKTRNVLLSFGALLMLLVIGIFSRYLYVNKAKNSIEKEKKRSDDLLLNILPAEIAEELKEKGRAEARSFDQVSILFTDFVSFTQASEKLSATELVEEISACFEAFDDIAEQFQIEKIKTIGDSYMAAGGLPLPHKDAVKNTVLAALEMQDYIQRRRTQKALKGETGFEMRAGIHVGSVVAGIVGRKKFQYDIWGDAVNTASRMESYGKAGAFNISQETYTLLKDDVTLAFKNRGKNEVKGKGEIDMWFVKKAV